MMLDSMAVSVRGVSFHNVKATAVLITASQPTKAYACRVVTSPTLIRIQDVVRGTLTNSACRIARSRGEKTIPG